MKAQNKARTLIEQIGLTCFTRELRNPNYESNWQCITRKKPLCFEQKFTHIKHHSYTRSYTDTTLDIQSIIYWHRINHWILDNHTEVINYYTVLITLLAAIIIQNGIQHVCLQKLSRGALHAYMCKLRLTSC